MGTGEKKGRAPLSWDLIKARRTNGTHAGCGIGGSWILPAERRDSLSARAQLDPRPTNAPDGVMSDELKKKIVCLSVYLCACLPARLPACLSVCLPACLPAFLPASLSASLPVCLPFCQSVSLSVCLRICCSKWGPCGG